MSHFKTAFPQSKFDIREFDVIPEGTLVKILASQEKFSPAWYLRGCFLTSTVEPSFLKKAVPRRRYHFAGSVGSEGQLYHVSGVHPTAIKTGKDEVRIVGSLVRIEPIVEGHAFYEQSNQIRAYLANFS